MSYEDLPERLEAVRERIGRAAGKSDRDSSSIGIVAVTKTHPAEAVRAVVGAGLHDVGENRIQELEEKSEEVGRHAVRWHVIGHLQRNKAKSALELGDLIHSVDSLRLARKLSREAEQLDLVSEVLIQVNLSGEESKGGLEGEDMLEQLGVLCELPNLRVRGLMTMAPLTDDESVVRSVFAGARELSERAASQIPSFESRYLSMGMSSDFEIAVEEGSNLVRLGTILLGEREQ